MKAKNFRSSFLAYPPHWVKVEDGTAQCAVNCGRYNSYSHNRIIKIYVINKAIKWNTAQDTDSSVARHNGATHFMVLLNIKGDKMQKICLNCKHSKQQFKNMVKDNNGSHKYPFDKSWDLAIDDPLICNNTKSYFRSFEVDDYHTCENYSSNKQREYDIKAGC